MLKASRFLTVLSSALLFVPFMVSASSSLYTQTITLAPGWNIVSTPRVLYSHAFSASETSQNFDIFVLDASQASQWATMAQEGQSEFTPLFGYFVNNKTGINQTLAFNYLDNSTPSSRLFQRTFSTTGWYSVGVANPTYAIPVGYSLSNTANPSSVLSTLAGNYSTAVDFTDGIFTQNQNSKSVAQSWKAATAAGVNILNDLRETKGYGIYISKSPALYSGFQNNNIVAQSPTLTVTSTIGNASTIVAQNIVANVSNVILGGFGTNISGEAVAVQTIPITITTSAASANLITSATLVDENGSVVAGPVDEVVTGATTGTITFTSTFVLPTGSHTYTIRGKVPATAANGSTLYLTTDPNLWTGTVGQTTGNGVALVSGSSPFTMSTMTVRTATLAASVSLTPAAQNIVAGTQNFVFANIQLDASQSSEDVRVSNLPVTIAVTGNAALSQLSACRVYNGGTSLTSGGNVVNPSSSPFSVTFDNSITVAKGTVTTLSVQCNVSSGATTGTFQVGLGTIGSFSSTGVTSGNAVTVSGSAGGGQIMTLGTGSFAISLDASSPSAVIAAGGTTGVTLGTYKFRAANDSVSLQRVGLQLTGTGTASDLAAVTLWNGSTQIGSATFSGASTHATSTLSTPLVLAKDTDVVITVKGDLAGVGSSLPGTSGHVIKVDIDTNGTNTQGVGVGSGSSINATGSTAVSGVTLYKSFPVVSQDTLSSTGVADGNLLRFKVTANSAGSIGIDQIAYNVSYVNATVVNAKLYAFIDAGYSVPVSGQASDGQVGAAHAVVTSGVSTSTAATTNPVQVAAGTTVYFVLRADIVPAAGAAVVTTVKGDASAVTPNTATSLEGVTNFFIWSPNTLGTAVKGDSQFVNGATIIGLPSAGISQARGL